MPLARKKKGCVIHRKCGFQHGTYGQKINQNNNLAGTYSQKINQSNNLAGHNGDEPWQRAKFVTKATTNTAKPPTNTEYHLSFFFPRTNKEYNCNK